MRALGGRTPYEMLLVRSGSFRICSVRHRRAEGSLTTEQLCVSLWVTSMKEAVIGFETREESCRRVQRLCFL